MYDITAPPIVRFVRESAGLSQRALAKRAKTTQAVVARIESGDTNPSVESLRRLVEAAGFELRLEVTERQASDPVVDAYKPGVDQTLLIENLRRTPEQRLQSLSSMVRFTHEMRKGMNKAKRVAEGRPEYAKDASRPPTDFHALLVALSAASVEFVVIGGVAANTHGSARVTWDLDVAYARNDANLTRLVRALEPFDPYLRGAIRGLPFEWSPVTLKAGLNFTLVTSIGDIDILGEVAGGGRYEQLIEHSVTESVWGLDAWVLDLPWLIRTKRAAGRPKDFEALAELELLRDLRDRQP